VATLGETIRESIAYLADRRVDSPALSARLLTGKALGLDAAGLVLHANRELGEGERAAVWELVRRRGEGEPVAYILGEKEFYGLSMSVAPGVLIPRPETEMLVDTALSLFDRNAPLTFADLGTGSGCIAAAVAVHFPLSRGFAVDKSRAALKIAVDNLARHGVDGRVLAVLGDFSFYLAQDARLDLILANPPYVSGAEYAALSREVAAYEPQSALLGGNQGYGPGLALAAVACQALAPGGALLMEMGAGQGPGFSDALKGPDYTFKSVSVLQDLAGLDRVVLAQK